MEVDQIKSATRGIIIDQIDRGSTIFGGRVREHVGNLRTMSGSLRNQGYPATADLVDKAANTMDRVSSYLIETDGNRMVHDAEEMARNQTMATAGAGFVVGLLAARLLKVSARERYQTYSPRTRPEEHHG